MNTQRFRPRHLVLAAALAVGTLAQAQVGDPHLKLTARLAQVPAVDLDDPRLQGHWAQQAERWQPGSDACASALSPPWERLTLGTHPLQKPRIAPGHRGGGGAVRQRGAG